MVIIICLFLSKRKDIKAMYLAIVILQVRLIHAFNEVPDVMQYEAARKNIIGMSFLTFGNLIYNQMTIHILLVKWRNMIGIVSTIFILLSAINKVFSYSDMRDNIGFILYICVFGMANSLLWLYIFSSILNLNNEQTLNMNNILYSEKV